MKKLFLTLFMLLIFFVSYAQTVENITVEPDGDKINIHYRIGGSTDKQVFNIQLTCSVDGGPRFEPKAVRGAVGGNILGGKDNYTIIWDVFKDREEVGNVEFFIKAELVSGRITESRSTEPEVVKPIAVQPLGAGSVSAVPYSRKRFITYEPSLLYPYGLRAGTLGNWGYHSSIRINYDRYSELMSGAITFGATKRIVNLPKYRLHGYLGIGLGGYFDVFDIEFGFSNVISNRLVLNIGYEIPTYYYALVLGAGIL
ncbi:MAG TPA: hypothetical protein ENN61_04140, partial [Bacteroidaceae bacterium]|nr:hypothetical protein [Bacteroidaceae bacterium]